MERKTQSQDGRIARDQNLRKQTVDHSYTDYSRVSDEEILDLIKCDLRADIGSCSIDQDSAFKRSGSSNNNSQEEILEELRKQPDMETKEKLRILCECLRRNTGGISKPFPLKLMEMLDNKASQHIVSWMPHGRAFKIHRHSQFVEIVLPQFFSNNIKYTSFNRQLNLWSFRRLTKGLDSGAYYHELFLRGKPVLAMRMKRQRIKGTGVKLASNPTCEPNFYEMDLPGLPEWKCSALYTTSFEEPDEAPSLSLTGTDGHSFVGREAQEREKKPSRGFVYPGLLRDGEVNGRTKSSASPSSMRESSQASLHGATEVSPEEGTKPSSGEKTAVRTKEASKTPACAYAMPQMPILQHTEFSSGLRVEGESVAENEEVLGIPRCGSLSSSHNPTLPNFAGRDPSLPKEIADFEFALQKQRQELELLTALTELKKQEYDIMVKMCQVGSNLHMVGPGNASTSPLASQESSTIRSALELLREQLASVRTLQRRQGLDQLTLPSLIRRQALPIASGVPFSLGGNIFSRSFDAPVSPGGAMAARRLSFLRSNRADDADVRLPFGVGSPTDTEEGDAEEQLPRT